MRKALARLMAGVVVMLACCLIGLHWRAAITSIEGRPPRVELSIGNQVHHLGQIDDRQEWRIQFPVRNAGTRRLVLNELDRDCGCEDQILETTVLQPGETGHLVVRLNPRSATGNVQSEACFATNDPALPRLELTVSAIVGASGVLTASARH